MPNFFAYVTLVVAPLCVVIFYKRFHPATACAGFFCGVLMFLPHAASFKPPGLPELDKEALVELALLLAAIISNRDRWRSMRLETSIRLLIFCLLIGGVFTVLLNQDALHYGPKTLPGHVPYDAVSSVLSDLLVYVIPFMLGRTIYRSPDDLRRLLIVMALAGFVYSLPAQFEMWLSPRLHQDFYGYAQNNFNKNRRLWGWRPLLFMQSGIAVGTFMATTAVAAGALQNARLAIGFLRNLPVTGYLILVVVFCKSTAAIIYTFIYATLMRFGGPGLLRSALMISTVAVLTWPILRFTDTAPTDFLVGFGSSITEERGGSLGYRFIMEDDAMEHTRERLFFGWGTYGRNRVYTETGKMQSIFDAFYIIIASQRGMVGLVCVFALLSVPIFKLLGQWPKIKSTRNRTLAAGLGFILVVRLLDMVQNGFYTSLPLLLSGALLGVIPGLCRDAHKPAGHVAGV